MNTNSSALIFTPSWMSDSNIKLIESNRPIQSNKKVINPVLPQFCDMFLYQKFIKGPHEPFLNHNEFKKNYDELYNDIYDIENNIVYIEENFIDKPFLNSEDYENEPENLEIEYESTDDEIETNEWMFNMY